MTENIAYSQNIRCSEEIRVKNLCKGHNLELKPKSTADLLTCVTASQFATVT